LFFGADSFGDADILFRHRSKIVVGVKASEGAIWWIAGTETKVADSLPRSQAAVAITQ